MTRNESNGPAAGSAAEMLKLARSATARIVTAAIEATAEAADIERGARRRAAGAAGGQAGSADTASAALGVDPEQIRAFARSDDYQALVERYIAGRLDGHLLTSALEMLRRLLPPLFAA